MNKYCAWEHFTDEEVSLRKLIDELNNDRSKLRFISEAFYLKRENDSMSEEALFGAADIIYDYQEKVGALTGKCWDAVRSIKGKIRTTADISAQVRSSAPEASKEADE